jgi:hypothetical protein
LGGFALAMRHPAGLPEIRGAWQAMARRLLALPGISGDRQDDQLRQAQ